MTEDRYHNIPEAMKALKNWCCFKLEEREGRKTKVPYHPKGYKAKSNTPETWCSFEEAVAAEDMDGIGFMFSESPYVGIDIDHCVENGELSALAQEIITTLGSYTEYSPSGQGIHIICEGEMPFGGNKNTLLGLEMYAHGRFFTMTGNVLQGYEKLVRCQNEVEIIHRKYLYQEKKESKKLKNNLAKEDENILALAMKSKNGKAFEDLYNGRWQGRYASQSEADIAFCNHLAFWTGCDFEKMDSIFRNSGLMRPKWDEIHGIATYGSMTLTKAIDDCTNVYRSSAARDFKDLIIPDSKEVPNNVAASEFEKDAESGKIRLKGLDYARFASYLIEKYHIVKIEKVLHYYSNGLYIYLSDDEFDGIIINEVYNSKINNRKEFHKYVKYYAQSKTPSDYRYILFNNGIYDLESKALLPVSTDFVFCNRIPHNYNEKAPKSELFERFLSDLVRGDPEGITLLKQVIGYTFCRKNLLQEFFFILGNGGNGKSTFLNFMSYLIGEENTSFLTLEDMKDNFNLPLLKNKLLNIGDDIENEYIERIGALKKAITGETITAWGKYKDKEPMKFYGKILFSGNTIPPMNDKTNGMKRRINVLPFLNNFKDSPDIDLSAKLAKEKIAEYAIQVGMKHLESVIGAKQFIKPSIVKIATGEYNKKNNHVIEFIEEHKEVIEQKEAPLLYSTYYHNFCTDCGYKRLGRNEFYQRMEEQGYKRARKQNLPDRPYMFVKIG